MESFLSGYSKGYTGNVGINYTGGVSGAQAAGGASSNGANADVSQLKPGDTFQGEITSVNGEDVQIQLANGQYLAAKLERDVQVALGQLLNLQVQSNKDNKVVLKPVADGKSQMLRVGEAALKAANMSVNEKNLQLVAKLIENGMPINKNTLMTYNRLALQNPKVPLSNIIELNKLKLSITEDNARQLDNYRNMEHKILDGVKDAANELVKTYESIVSVAKQGVTQGNMQSNVPGNMPGSTQSSTQSNTQSSTQSNTQSSTQSNMQSNMHGSALNLPALENGARFMEKVLSLVAGEGAEEGAAAESKIVKSENNINIAKNIDNTLNEGLKGGIKAENDVNIAKNENNANNVTNTKIGNNTNNVNTASDLNNLKTENNVTAANDASNTKVGNNVTADSQAIADSRVTVKADGNTDMNAGEITRSENAAKAESSAKAENIANTENIAKAESGAKTENGAKAENIAKTENIAKAESSGKALTVPDNKIDAENAQRDIQRNTQKSDFTGSVKTESGEVLTEKTHYLPKSATTLADKIPLNNSVNEPKADIKGEQTLNQAQKLPATAEAKPMPETDGNFEMRKSEEVKEIENRLKGETPKTVPDKIINYISSGKLDIKALQRLLTDTGIGKSLTPEQKSRIFDSEPFKRLLKDGLGKRWSLSPADIASEGKVEEFYSKLLKESSRLAKLINEAMHPAASAQTAGAAHAKAMGNIAENVEFMNQMNQMFNYVQLPLKFGDSQAHGDLYVYTNKKNIAKRDGMLTAFLHLDMDNLGPLDVSIALQTDKMQITAKFYIGEDSIKLVGEHIGELAARLEQKGYKCKSMVLEKDEDKTVLEHIEEQVAAGNAVIGYRKFDTRA